VNRFRRRRQVEQFAGTSLARVLFELQPQWLLADVRPEGLNLAFQVNFYVNRCGYRSQGDGLPPRQSEVSGCVVQLLSAVRSDRVA
jgi:hypothetical protein